MKDEVALLATVTLLGVLLQGELAPVWEVGGPQTLQPAFFPAGPGEVLEAQAQMRGRGGAPTPESGVQALLTPLTDCRRLGCPRAEGLVVSQMGRDRLRDVCRMNGETRQRPRLTGAVKGENALRHDSGGDPSTSIRTRSRNEASREQMGTQLCWAVGPECVRAPG